MHERLTRAAHSIGRDFRKRRFLLVRRLFDGLPRPFRIIDVGGSQWFWDQMAYVDVPGVEIVIVNLDRYEARRPGFVGLKGDARELGMFQDGEFDVAFSNSVIEHVGSWEDQQAMAREVRRVARRYIVQTPNRGFPIEPHFVFPFFQFLPLAVRVALVQSLKLGLPEARSPSYVASVRLLTAAEMIRLFPGCRLIRETALGLTKSLTAIGGFDAVP